jgi:hypothetical protein
MWKRLLETTKQAATAALKPTAASGPKRATPTSDTVSPRLSTLKNHSSSRCVAVTAATALTQASLLHLKQAMISKKNILSSSLPHAQAQGTNHPAPLFWAPHLSLRLSLSHLSPSLAQMWEEDPPHALVKALMSILDGNNSIKLAYHLILAVSNRVCNRDLVSSTLRV